MDKIKVAVIDDHDMVRKGLISYLITEDKIEIVGEGSSGKEAVKLVRETRPDVVLMDLLMENGTGIDATKKLWNFIQIVKLLL